MHAWRYLLRQWSKSPGFTAVAVLTLAVGIGANVVVFSVAKAVLGRPLGFQDEDRLMWVRLARAHSSMSEAALSWREIEDLRQSVPSFAAVSTFGSTEEAWEVKGDSVDVEAMRARLELADVLQVRPVLGRFFRAEEIQSDAPVALLGHGSWKSRFGADPGVLGQTVRLGGKAREIVGVMPEGFRFPIEGAPSPGTGSHLHEGEKGFWLPMGEPGQEDRTSRGARMFPVVARLKPGVTPAQARAEMAVLASRLAEESPETNRDVEYALTSFRDQVLGRARHGIPLLGGAVAAVLLVCCVNLANLLLARGLSRRRELAVRLAMGAARTRLMRESLGESLILAVSGGLAGVGLATLGLHGLRGLAASTVPFIEEVKVDGTVVGFAVGLCVLTALVFGLLPAWHQSRADAAEALRTGGRSVGDPRIRTWQNRLATGQVAAVLVLVLAAGALLESFRRLLGQDLGYQAKSVVTMDLTTRNFDTNGDVCRFYRALRERLAALPGVQAVGTISSVPLTGKWTFAERPNVVGRPLPEADRPAVAATFVAFDYFPAMGIPLLEGRLFSDAELDDHGYGLQVILNATAARVLFPGQSAVGGRFTVGSNPDRVLEVIGVVKDTRDVRLEDAPVPRFYWQYAFGGAQVVVRADRDATALIPMLRQAVTELDRRARVNDARPLTSIVGATVADRRFLMIMVTVYAGIALAIALLGIYGVVSYQVAQRRTEFGVRLALGGFPAHLLRLVLARSARMVLWGVGAGLLISLGTNRLLAGQMYGLSPHDPMLLAVVSTVLLVVALLASAGPARRAARLHPMEALRNE